MEQTDTPDGNGLQPSGSDGNAVSPSKGIVPPDAAKRPDSGISIRQTIFLDALEAAMREGRKLGMWFGGELQLDQMVKQYPSFEDKSYIRDYSTTNYRKPPPPESRLISGVQNHIKRSVGDCCANVLIRLRDKLRKTKGGAIKSWLDDQAYHQLMDVLNDINTRLDADGTLPKRPAQGWCVCRVGTDMTPNRDYCI